jgi:hypothetical protein
MKCQKKYHGQTRFFCPWCRALPSNQLKALVFLLLPAVYVAGYAPSFLVERRFLKTPHKTKQATTMRNTTKKALR